MSGFIFFGWSEICFGVSGIFFWLVGNNFFRCPEFFLGGRKFVLVCPEFSFGLSEIIFFGVRNFFWVVGNFLDVRNFRCPAACGLELDTCACACCMCSCCKV